MFVMQFFPTLYHFEMKHTDISVVQQIITYSYFIRYTHVCGPGKLRQEDQRDLTFCLSDCFSQLDPS